MKICIVYAHDELISDTKNLCAELVNRYDAQVRFFPSILKSELDDLSGYDAVILLYNPRDLPDLEDFIDEIKAQVVLGSWLPIMATRCHEDVSDIERFWPFRHMIYSDPGALANKIGRLLSEHQRTPDESLLRGDAQPSPNGLSELEMLGFSGLRRGYLAPKRPGVVEQSPWLEVKLENFQPLSRHDVSEAMPPMAEPPWPGPLGAGSSLLTQLAVVAAVVGFAQAIGYWDEITAWFASLLKALFHSATPPLPAPSAPPPQASEALVDVSAYAPSRVRKGRQFLVQVFVHDPAQEREAATLAKEADFKAVRRGIATLDVEIAIGERLDFMLEAGGLTISKPLQGLVWRGTPQSRSFIVTVPQDFAGESAIICVQVLRQSVPIGQISFSMELVADVAAPTPGFGAMSAVDRSDWPLEPMGDAARRFRRAFLSYASPRSPGSGQTRADPARIWSSSRTCSRLNPARNGSRGFIVKSKTAICFCCSGQTPRASLSGSTRNSITR